MPMLKFIDKILCSFESCFSRKAAFQWFVVIVVGLMLRSDKLGLTSIIRDLALQQDSYLSMLHFFRASSWSLDDIRQRWFQTLKESAPLYREQEWCVLVGDGVKQSKEGRRIPGVKKLFQESENSAKPAYIHGHMFGGLGILAGNSYVRACIPLSIRLHDGLSAASAWTGTSASSHIVKMVEDAYLAAKEFGNALLLLDRYFLSVPALERLAQLNLEGSVRMEIVSKAKRNCTAYEKPAPRSSKRGRPQKKGDASPMELVTEEHSRKKILEAVRAIEMHMMVSCIAMGILQCLSLNVCTEDGVPIEKLRYLRTPSKKRISEATVMYYLRKHIFRIMNKSPELRIISKERTEGGLNKRAAFVPSYSAHFWFFRIEQSRVRYMEIQNLTFSQTARLSEYTQK